MESTQSKIWPSQLERDPGIPSVPEAPVSWSVVCGGANKFEYENAPKFLIHYTTGGQHFTVNPILTDEVRFYLFTIIYKPELTDSAFGYGSAPLLKEYPMEVEIQPCKVRQLKLTSSERDSVKFKLWGRETALKIPWPTYSQEPQC